MKKLNTSYLGDYDDDDDDNEGERYDDADDEGRKSKLEDDFAHFRFLLDFGSTWRVLRLNHLSLKFADKKVDDKIEDEDATCEFPWRSG